MQLLVDILKTLPDGPVEDVRIGIHWTAVVVQIAGELRCGLASTVSPAHHLADGCTIRQVGFLTQSSARNLAELAISGSSTETSIGLATMNALLPRRPEAWREQNAEEVIAAMGAGRKVALIGHFPFISSLQKRVGELTVLELDPGPGDLPASEAPRVLPAAEVVAITGMTIANGTLEELLNLCSPKAQVMVLGPTTLLSPLFFNYGVDVLSGAVVTNIPPVLRAVSQGGCFRQIHHHGVRLVNIHREDFE